MKLTPLFFVMTALFVAGCENLHQTVRTGTILSDAPPGQPALLIGNHDFTDFDSVKTYIRALPPGAILSWDTTAMGPELVPVPKADMTVNDFADFCRQNGVDFRFATDDQMAVRRVLILRASGFRTFCDILSSPVMSSTKTRQAFTDCGVTYASNLQTFFEAAGITFPLKTSLVYDRSNGRIILINPAASEERIRQIIRSCQTKEFDEKIQCLATRLQGRQLVQ